MFKEEVLKKSYKNVELIRCVSANVINKANFEEEKIDWSSRFKGKVYLVPNILSPASPKPGQM